MPIKPLKDTGVDRENAPAPRPLGQCSAIYEVTGNGYYAGGLQGCWSKATTRNEKGEPVCARCESEGNPTTMRAARERFWCEKDEPSAPPAATMDERVKRLEAARIAYYGDVAYWINRVGELEQRVKELENRLKIAENA